MHGATLTAVNAVASLRGGWESKLVQPYQGFMEKTRAHVVVLGGGFGGLTFCNHFSHPRARTTLVDRTNHHLFQPLLYQVAMAGLSAPDIAQPIRSILAHHAHLEVLMDEVQSVDLAAKKVV